MIDFADFYVNRLVFPAAGTILFFLLLHYKPAIKSKITLLYPNHVRWFYPTLLANLRLRPGSWRTIAIPILLTLLLYVSISFAFQLQPTSYGEQLWFAALTSGFLSPIAEEFVIRGILLGCFVILANTRRKPLYYPVLATGLAITSAVFLTGHINVSLFQFTLRLSSSLLFGLLYLAFRGNLLPSIISHAAWNWAIIIRELI